MRLNGAGQSMRESIVGAWRATLEQDSPSDEENFFESGGNSILLVEFQRRLSEALGFGVALREIFENPTVAGIQARLSGRAESAASPGTHGPQEPVRLFCLPYAGCSARIYEPWKDKLADSIAVRPVELPGRGARCTEKPVSELPALLDDLTRAIAPETGSDYVVFGHSFGAVIAYELVKHLEAGSLPGPRALVVSGCRAPHQATPARAIHDRTDAEFREGLRRVGGTPKELLENDELMELYLPVIRADYRILDLYRPLGDRPEVDCDIIALYGSEDPDADESDVRRWGAYTKGSFTVHEVTGNHFFLHSAEDQVQAHILRDLVPPPISHTG
ncbi:alpha/beta fold hydrolase [Streptomyces macrosporus]|uniref:Carrier domain-containing protein n=1 Tax=Streptomyces macrosporus TaxID=44032 RepID=A0ABP5XQ99_9ACTN